MRISTLPSQMEYIEVPNAGEASVMRIARGPLPIPKSDEVLIRVMAAGVNRPDVLQRKGLYPMPPSASPILGLEVAGEVVGVGSEVTSWRIGERVCALANGGGYAQYCAAPATQCLPWPKDYTATQAAVLPETYFTVWANLFQHNRITHGESLLVHGGSSGIGLTAIQLGCEFGAKVYTTVGSKDKQDACIRAGASVAINYKEENFAKKIQEITGGAGVDVILDMVGAPYFQDNLDSLALDGRLVQISVMLGAKVEQFSLFQLMSRRLMITGSTLRPRTSAQKAAIAQSLRQRLWPILDVGRCAPVLYKVFDFSEAVAAHQLMESSQHIGKIVLKIDQ
jgi:NADPH2:quinone reductase